MSQIRHVSSVFFYLNMIWLFSKYLQITYLSFYGLKVHKTEDNRVIFLKFANIFFFINVFVKCHLLADFVTSLCISASRSMFDLNNITTQITTRNDNKPKDLYSGRDDSAVRVVAWKNVDCTGSLHFQTISRYKRNGNIRSSLALFWTVKAADCSKIPSKWKVFLLNLLLICLEYIFQNLLSSVKMVEAKFF